MTIAKLWPSYILWWGQMLDGGDDGCHEFHPLTKCNHQSSIARAPSWPSSKWASSSLSSSWSVPSSFWWSSYFAKWRYQWFVEYCPVIYATNKRYWAQNHIIKIKILHADLLAPTGALVVAPLQLFHITSSRSSKSLYNLLTLLKNLEHLCLYI